MDAREIRRAAGACLKRVDPTPTRLLGVRAGALATLAELVAPLPAMPDCADQPVDREAFASASLPLFGAVIGDA
jgi:DNA polymerase-4